MTSAAASPGPARAAEAAPASGVGERLLAWIEASHARAGAVLVALCLLCFLPGFVSLQPMDRDEPRFAQASKQMLETGDLVDIRFQEEARHKKPVGIYWLQAGAVAAGEALGVPESRTTIALYRVPSLVGGVLGVLLSYWAALAFLTRRDAVLAAALVAASIVLAAEARLAKTDAVLLACTTAALGALARAYLGRFTAAARLSTPVLVAVWIAVGVGILVKGPMVIVFTGLAALVLAWRERSLRWLLALRPGLGAAITAAVVLPWFVAITLRSGGAFYAESVGHDMLGKVGGAQTYHWAPPGFYALSFFATFWPGAALAAIAAPWAWRERRDDRVAFALAWIVPAWALLEAVPTKLPHYVLPLFPAIAILTVLAIRQGAVGPHRPFGRATALLIPLIPAGLAAGLVVGGLALDDVVPWAGLALVLLSTAVAALAWRAFNRGDAGGAAMTGVAASLLLSAGVIGLAQPVLPALKLSPRLAAVARGLACEGRQGAAQVGTLGYREPSLVFLVGTGLDMHESAAESADFLRAAPCRMVFVERRFRDAFRETTARAGVSAAPVATLPGFNINGGRRLEIEAYTARP